MAAAGRRPGGPRGLGRLDGRDRLVGPSDLPRRAGALSGSGAPPGRGPGRALRRRGAHAARARGVSVLRVAGAGPARRDRPLPRGLPGGAVGDDRGLRGAPAPPRGALRRGRGFFGRALRRALGSRAPGADRAPAGRPSPDPRCGLRSRRGHRPGPRAPSGLVGDRDRARPRARRTGALALRSGPRGRPVRDPAGARAGGRALRRDRLRRRARASRGPRLRARRRAPGRLARGAPARQRSKRRAPLDRAGPHRGPVRPDSGRTDRRGTPALVHALVPRRGDRGGRLDARPRSRASRERLRPLRASSWRSRTHGRKPTARAS